MHEVYAELEGVKKLLNALINDSTLCYFKGTAEQIEKKTKELEVENCQTA